MTTVTPHMNTMFKTSLNIIVEEVMTTVTPHTNTMLNDDIPLNVIVEREVPIATAIPYTQTIMNTLNDIIPCTVVGPVVEGTSNFKYRIIYT